MPAEHHRGSHGPAGRGAHAHPPGRGEEPPAEPGYPEHPEQPHGTGNLRGSEASPTHPPAHGHGSHAKHGGGHDKHQGHMLGELLGYHPPSFSGSGWIAPVFGTAVFLYGGGSSCRERRAS